MKYLVDGESVLLLILTELLFIFMISISGNSFWDGVFATLYFGVFIFVLVVTIKETLENKKKDFLDVIFDKMKKEFSDIWDERIKRIIELYKEEKRNVL